MEAGGIMDSAAALTPDFVGKLFISQYYNVLYNCPDVLHRFYKENSKVGRVGQDGVMRHFFTLQGIKTELESSTYGDLKSAEITSYDAQQSHDGGILVVVTGYFTIDENLRRKFTQAFFLAPQETGFFVLNDILRFVNEDVKENVPEAVTGEADKSEDVKENVPEAINGEVDKSEDVKENVPEAINGEVVDGKSSARPSVTNAPTGNKGSKQAASISVNPVWKEVSKPLNNEKAKENVLVSEIVKEKVPEIEVTCKEVADDPLKHDGPEDVPKKSYASVLKVTMNTSGVSAVSSLSPKQIPNNQEHEAPSDSSPGQILKNEGQQASSDPSQVIESDTVSEDVDANESGQNQEAILNGTSIYVKHLPANANIDMVETAFKKFGAICSDGVQVISHRNFGYPFGFVEFEEADAAQRAIEASPVIISGQRAFVEEKLSTLRGNRRTGEGEHGNRNGGVGVRGRGGYGYGYRRGGGGGGGGGRSFNRRGDEHVASISSY